MHGREESIVNALVEIPGDIVQAIDDGGYKIYKNHSFFFWIFITDFL